MFPHLLWDGNLTLAGKRGYSHSDSFFLLDSLPTCKDSIVRVLRAVSIAGREVSRISDPRGVDSHRGPMAPGEREGGRVSKAQQHPRQRPNKAEISFAMPTVVGVGFLEGLERFDF